MKKMLLGIALILVGILLEIVEINNPWIPIVDAVPFDIIGLVIGIVGIGIAISGYRKKEE